MKKLKSENRHMREKITELRGQQLIDKENGRDNGEKKRSHKSKERKTSSKRE